MNPSDSYPPIDLSRAIPPTPPELEEALASTITKLALSGCISSSLRRNRVGGTEADRAAAAKWLGRRIGHEPEAGRIIIANGTQSLLGLLFYEILTAGEVLLAEALTYPVLCPLAKRFGVHVEPVAIDTEGILPEALETACRRHRPKALFCNPTVHNPTTATMGGERRKAVVELARQYNLMIFEDDVLGSMHGNIPRPLATIGPDIVWYIQSLSKCVSLGLKIAYMVTPTRGDAEALVASVANHSFWFPSAMSAEIATALVNDGAVARTAAAIAEQAHHRQKIARKAFDGVPFAAQRGGLHIWVPLTLPRESIDFVEAANREGVSIRPADMFVVKGKDRDRSFHMPGVRIALTTPDTDDLLETGLLRLKRLLRP